MDSGTDIRQHLDTCFGDGPAHRPVGDRLSAGRRVVRNRRGAVGLTALATAGILASTGWALTGVRGTSTTGSFLGTPDDSALPVLGANATPPGCLIDVLDPVPARRAAPPVPGDPAVAWTYTVHCDKSDMPPIVFLGGVLYRATEDVRVDRLIEPAGPAGGTAAAAVVEVGGQTQWVFTEADQGNLTHVTAPSPEGQTFAEWAASGPTVRVTGLASGSTSDASGPAGTGR